MAARMARNIVTSGG